MDGRRDLDGRRRCKRPERQDGESKLTASKTRQCYCVCKECGQVSEASEVV